MSYTCGGTLSEYDTQGWGEEGERRRVGVGGGVLSCLLTLSLKLPHMVSVVVLFQSTSVHGKKEFL